ncbi:hypothetical protein ACIBCN_19820 [Nocardia sp. NPDC051052]|uniref:hypothetical protein n=1 Tax=Nocardia sp. NPDC051052 TaxID=3364322 RepID=UPI0037AB2253
MESPLRREAHGGFGGRPRETDREQSRHRARGRPNHCAVGMHNKEGELLKVRCPSVFCTGLVALIDGRIAPHDGTVPGHCPWIGTRVVDDTADFDPDYVANLRAKREA